MLVNCDSFLSNLSGLRYPLVGGRLGSGEPCGPFCIYGDITPTDRDFGVGAHSNLLDFYGSDIYVSYVLPLVTSG